MIFFPISEGESSNYRPPFLDHFDKTDSSKSKDLPNESSSTLLAQGKTNVETSTLTNSNTNNLPNADVQEKAQEILNKRLLEQISGGQIQDGPSLAGQGYSSTSPGNNNTSPSMGGGGDNNQTKFQRCIAEGDLDFVSIARIFQIFLTLQKIKSTSFICSTRTLHFNVFQLKFLSFDELKGKMSNLDQDMEREIDDLRRRYHAKRQPILDAMDQKRKRQQNF